MKKNNLIAGGAAAMVALVAVTGMALSTFAAESDALNDADSAVVTRNASMRGERGERGERQNLSDEEKAEKEAERETRRAEAEARRAVVDAAVEAGDYNAWLEAVGEDHPFVGKITADNFSKLQDIHDLKAEMKLKNDEVKTIMDELGIEAPGKGERGGMQGMEARQGKKGGRGVGSRTTK